MKTQDRSKRRDDLTRDRESFRALGSDDSHLVNSGATDLLTRYHDRFVRYLMRDGYSQADAQDAVAQVFCRLIEKRHGLDKVNAPTAYLWKMLKNAAIEYQRSAYMRREVQFEDPLMEAAADSSTAVSTTLTEYAATQECLDCLAEAFREFELKYESSAEYLILEDETGLGVSDLAKIYGINEHAMSERLSSARRKWRQSAAQTCRELCGVAA